MGGFHRLIKWAREPQQLRTTALRAVTHDPSLSGRVSRSADTRPTAGSIAWLLGRQAMPYFWLMSAVCSHWRLTMSVNNVGGQNDDGQRRPTITVTTIHHLQETITLNKPSTIQSQLNHTTVQRCACVSDEHKFCQLLVTNYTAPFC